MPIHFGSLLKVASAQDISGNHVGLNINSMTSTVVLSLRTLATGFRKESGERRFGLLEMWIWAVERGSRLGLSLETETIVLGLRSRLRTWRNLRDLCSKVRESLTMFFFRTVTLVMLVRDVALSVTTFGAGPLKTRPWRTKPVWCLFGLDKYRLVCLC